MESMTTFNLPGGAIDEEVVEERRYVVWAAYLVGWPGECVP